MFSREIRLGNEEDEADAAKVINVLQSSVGSEASVVWDSAIVLAHAIHFNRNDIFDVKKRLNVLELGAGTGVVGIAAAAVLGNGNFVLTDLDVDLVNKNIALNKDAFESDVAIEARKLRWGENLEESAVYDVILVSDCVYYSESLRPLLRTLEAASHSETLILFAYEEREDKIKVREEFFDLLETESDLEVVKAFGRSECHPEFQSADIKVLQLRLQKKRR